MDNLYEQTHGEQCIRNYFYKDSDIAFKIGKNEIPTSTKIISFFYFPEDKTGNIYFFNPMQVKILSFEDISFMLLLKTEVNLLQNKKIELITEDKWEDMYQFL